MDIKNKYALGQEVFVSFSRGKVSRFIVWGVEYHWGELRYLLHDALDETYARESMIAASEKEALKIRYLIDKEDLEAQLKGLTKELDKLNKELEKLK